VLEGTLGALSADERRTLDELVSRVRSASRSAAA